jgi:nucleotide-binding universal stress UspA family protein
MKLNKILWPTDFSRSAKQAMHHINYLTEKHQPEIHVLYVIEDLAHHESWYGDFQQPHIEKIMKWEKETATKRLDQICEKYLEGCPLYIKHIAIGDPANEILKFIENEKVDMVVMASQGRKGYFSFGSVAEKVVKNSKVPVTTIPILPEA